MKKEKHLIINLQAAKIAKIKRVLHTAVNTPLPADPKKAKTIVADPKSANDQMPADEVEIILQTANLEVEFNNVDAGLSDFTATHNGAAQTIHASGSISFNNVKTNDTILIKGDSAGSTNVKISGVTAQPMEMNFDAGQHIGGLFFIIS
jgi:hypothetical protein